MATDDSAVEHRVTQILVKQLQIEAPRPDMDLMESGLLDSLTFVELLFDVEREFSLAIPLDSLDLDQFRSVRTISAFIQRRLSEDGASPDAPEGRRQRVERL